MDGTRPVSSLCFFPSAPYLRSPFPRSTGQLESPPHSIARAGGDTVELSPAARISGTSPTASPSAPDHLALARSAIADPESVAEAPIRFALVGRVRAEIAAGTYVSDLRLSRALDALLDAIGE